MTRLPEDGRSATTAGQSIKNWVNKEWKKERPTNCYGSVGRFFCCDAIS